MPHLLLGRPLADPLVHQVMHHTRWSVSCSEEAP